MEHNAVEGRKKKVDKRDKGVTIKINGETKQYVDKKEIPIINKNDEAAARESSDESFDWVLPNEIRPSSAPKKVKIHHYQKRNTIKLKTPIILAIVAILVGTSLGLIVIRTITSEQAVPQVQEPPKQNIPATAPVAEPSTENMTVQAFFVQGGVFSTEESAKQVQAFVHQKNVPAEVFQVDNSFYVFLGTAENLAAAKELALYYKNKEIEVFWKEIDIKTNLAKENPEVEKLLSAYSALAEVSAAQLRKSTPNVEVSQVKSQLNEVQSSEHKEILSEAADLLQNNQPSKAQEKLLIFLQEIAK